MDEQQTPGNAVQVSKETLWYLDNYILLKDYLDRTISRIAARCIRQNNIAMEEYPFYGYILDVLEEISETGDFILAHKELYPLVEKKIQGGMNAFRKNLGEYKQELRNNSTPEMIKQDTNQELEQMKEALGMVDKSEDPTVGAGMSMDEVIEKLMNKQNLEADPDSSLAQTQAARQQQQVNASRPQPQAGAPRPAPQPQVQSAPQNPAAQQTVPGQPRIIKKIVKIVKPAAAPAAQAVPNKVTEE